MFETVMFYKSYDDAIEDLNEQEQMIMYKAIIRYGLYEEIPRLDGFLKTMWKLILPQIEANHRNYNNGKKGGRPKKEDTKETVDKKPSKKPQTKNKPKSIEAVTNMSKELVRLFTKPESVSFDIHESNDRRAVEKFILDNSDNKNITDDYNLMDDAYTKIRKHLIKTENIYSLTYKNNDKRKKDTTTEEVHKHMSLKREDLENASGEKSEIEFYESFYDDYKDKSVTILGIEYDVDFAEEQFFLKGTKKTGEFGSGRLMEEVWRAKCGK